MRHSCSNTAKKRGPARPDNKLFRLPYQPDDVSDSGDNLVLLQVNIPEELCSDSRYPNLLRSKEAHFRYHKSRRHPSLFVFNHDMNNPVPVLSIVIVSLDVADNETKNRNQSASNSFATIKLHFVLCSAYFAPSYGLDTTIVCQSRVGPYLEVSWPCNRLISRLMQDYCVESLHATTPNPVRECAVRCQVTASSRLVYAPRSSDQTFS